MKTIITTLPVYNRLEKQCYQRSKKSSVIGAVPCPEYRLPAMQWNVEDDDPGAITNIYLVDTAGTETDILYMFGTGNLLTNASALPINVGYDSFTDYAGVALHFDAIKTTAPGIAYVYTDTFNVIANTTVLLRTSLTLTSGTAPKAVIVNAAGDDISNIITVTETADQYIVFTVTETDVSARIRFRNLDTELSNYELEYYVYTSVAPALLTDLTDAYFQYNGDTLGTLLTSGALDYGLHYLKIVTEDYIYYSEWFNVTCIYPNLITGWRDTGNFLPFTSSGVSIIDAWNFLGVPNYCDSSPEAGFHLIKGQSIRIIYFHTQVSGTLPRIYIYNITDSEESDWVVSTEGLNDITLTADKDAYYDVRFWSGTFCRFSTSEVLVMYEYSEKYTRIDFSNTCDLGDIVYAEGMEQTLWIKSELMEATFPMTPEGSEDGNGLFIPTFRRQEKLQVLRTPLITQVMVECLYRLMLHDTITIIDLVGDTWTVKSLETEHEWQGDDKYYALAELTFDLDEVFVIAGCCNNIT